jgi:hypothetical protein
MLATADVSIFGDVRFAAMNSRQRTTQLKRQHPMPNSPKNFFRIYWLRKVSESQKAGLGYKSFK